MSVFQIHTIDSTKPHEFKSDDLDLLKKFSGLIQKHLKESPESKECRVRVRDSVFVKMLEYMRHHAKKEGGLNTFTDTTVWEKAFVDSWDASFFKSLLADGEKTRAYAEAEHLEMDKFKRKIALSVLLDIQPLLGDPTKLAAKLTEFEDVKLGNNDVQ
jgi:hypothetical protein